MKENNDYYILKEYLNKNLAKKAIKALIMLDHKNIIKLNNFYFENNKYYLKMKYYQKGNLQQRLSCRKCCLKLSQKWIIQLLEIRKFLKTKKISHNDIKPNNILLDEQENLILIDFGSVCFGTNNSISDYKQIDLIINLINNKTIITSKL